ncbi:MAG: hypothetical protein RIF41_29370 [Polyangiaceae bacterium]
MVRSVSPWLTLLLAVAGCASVVGADFGDYTLAGDSTTSANGGAAGVGGGPGAGGNGAGPMGGGEPTIEDVGIVYAQSGADIAGALESSLADYFETVESVNANQQALDDRQLMGFDAIVVANDSAWTHLTDTTAAVDTFVSQGGRMVALVGAFCTGLNLGEGFADQFTFLPGPIFTTPELAGRILEPSPLFDGVGALGSWRGCTVTLAQDAEALARYQDDTPLAAKRVVEGRTRVDINILPDTMSPALGQLIANAIRYPE